MHSHVCLYFVLELPESKILQNVFPNDKDISSCHTVNQISEFSINTILLCRSLSTDLIQFH